jgi:hypothetical protein
MRLLDLNEAASKSAEIKGPLQKLTKICVAPCDPAGYSRARIPEQPLLKRAGSCFPMQRRPQLDGGADGMKMR